MPNTSYSEAMKEAATLAATDTVIIDTIEIAHPDIDSIYLANDRTELIAATGPGDGVLSLPGIGGNYASVLPADITLPTDYLDARIIFGEDYRSNPNFDGNVIPLALHRIVSGLPIYQAWYLQVKSDGKMYFIAWDSSNVQSNFSSGVTIPTDADGMRAVFRGTDDLDPSKASVQFFYSRDSGTTWIELVNRVYAPTAATITSLKQTTGPITIGERLDDTPNPFHGTIKFVELYGAADETDLRLRVDFRDKAHNSGSFTNEEGVAVTVQTTPVDGDGYLYCDGVDGYASVPDPLGALGDFTMQVDGLSPETVRPAATVTLMSQQGGAAATSSFIIRIDTTGRLLFKLYDGTDEVYTTLAVPTDTVGIRVTRVGTLITYWVDTGSGYVSHDTDTSVGTVLNNPSVPVEIGIYKSTTDPLLGTISRAQIWDNGTATGTAVVDADFRNLPTTLTDTDTFVTTSGQTVTINGGATAYASTPATIVRTDSVTYEPVGFKFKLPSITGNGVQDLSLEFSNVDRRVNDFIDTVEASLDPVTVTHRVYLSGGDLNSVPESDPPLKLTLSDIEISAFTVRARASFVNIVNKQYPTDYYDRDRFPSI